MDHIAPIQAREDHNTSPQIVTSRQQILGDKDRSLGRIDADALCKRIKAGIRDGEFQAGQFVFVWLDVDPGLDFSADYWAGWSDTVNNSMLPIISQGSTLAQCRLLQVLRAVQLPPGADGRLSRTLTCSRRSVAPTRG